MLVDLIALDLRMVHLVKNTCRSISSKEISVLSITFEPILNLLIPKPTANSRSESTETDPVQSRIQSALKRLALKLNAVFLKDNTGIGTIDLSIDGTYKHTIFVVKLGVE